MQNKRLNLKLDLIDTYQFDLYGPNLTFQSHCIDDSEMTALEQLMFIHDRGELLVTLLSQSELHGINGPSK